jgi:hypothetical protein
MAYGAPAGGAATNVAMDIFAVLPAVTHKRPRKSRLYVSKFWSSFTKALGMEGESSISN